MKSSSSLSLVDVAEELLLGESGRSQKHVCVQSEVLHESIFGSNVAISDVLSQRI